MPNKNTQWYKDSRLIEALDQIRQRNMGFMSYCYFCGAKSIAIKAVQEKLFSVCGSHESDENSGVSVKSS
jgi:hypothetical protein